MCVQRGQSNLVNVDVTFILTKWPGKAEAGIEIKLQEIFVFCKHVKDRIM